MKGISSRTIFFFALFAALVVFIAFFVILNTTHIDRQINPAKLVLQENVNRKNALKLKQPVSKTKSHTNIASSLLVKPQTNDITSNNQKQKQLSLSKERKYSNKGIQPNSYLDFIEFEDDLPSWSVETDDLVKRINAHHDSNPTEVSLSSHVNGINVDIDIDSNRKPSSDSSLLKQKKMKTKEKEKEDDLDDKDQHEEENHSVEALSSLSNAFNYVKDTIQDSIQHITQNNLLKSIEFIQPIEEHTISQTIDKGQPISVQTDSKSNPVFIDVVSDRENPGNTNSQENQKNQEEEGNSPYYADDAILEQLGRDRPHTLPDSQSNTIFTGSLTTLMSLQNTSSSSYASDDVYEEIDDDAFQHNFITSEASVHSDHPNDIHPSYPMPQRQQHPDNNNNPNLRGSISHTTDNSNPISENSHTDGNSNSNSMINGVEHTCQNTSYPLMCDIYPYVRFWKHRFVKPQDCFSSPLRIRGVNFRTEPEKLKYVVFMPDEGGWNNIRMAAETAIVFCIVTGRVLVMPPQEKFYLLDKNSKEDENISTFDKFFDLSKITEIVDIISMEDFLTYVAGNRLLSQPLPKIGVKQLMIPGNGMWSYIERACHTRAWHTGRNFIGFNLTTRSGDTILPQGPNGIGGARNSDEVILGNVYPDYSKGTRLKLFASHDRQVMSYNDSFHSERAIYFPGDYRETHRLLTHFYSYLYFSDPKLERYYKRMVRDRLHYHDEIFCIAGQVVQMLHQMSVEVNQGRYEIQSPLKGNSVTLGGDTNTDATYFAYHIRRGDFQYKFTQLSGEVIWENTKNLLDSNRTRLIYIATDEKKKEYFDPIRKGADGIGYKLVFLQDFIDRIRIPPHQDKINRNHLGMIEQVVCANAHTFIGTPLSTFTGYITRMRGYYRDNRYSRTYYTHKDYTHQLHQQHELKGPFWAREFAVAHKAVDDDFKLDSRHDMMSSV